MAIAVVCELVVASRKLLEALRGDGGEVPAELGVLRQNHRATRDEAVDQRLLPHLGFACSATDGLVIAHFSAASLSLDLARERILGRWRLEMEIDTFNFAFISIYGCGRGERNNSTKWRSRLLEYWK